MGTLSYTHLHAVFIFVRVLTAERNVEHVAEFTECTNKENDLGSNLGAWGP
jgi:hypothetical protein